MLLTALRKIKILPIAVLFGVFAIVMLASSAFTQPEPQSQVVAQSPQQTPSILPADTESLRSDSFAHVKESELNRLIFARDILRETTSFLTCQMKGIEPISPEIDCIKALQATNINHEELFKKSGPVAYSGDAIAALYRQPISGTDYISNLASNFGIQKAQAQEADPGTGFSSLSQIQNIWILFRNISYLLLVIVFVIVGVAIMLRLNIDPRTVMTIQNQIPKAIVAIVLITFSYAIGGFLVDAMWVSTYFSVNAISQTQPPCRVEGEDKTLNAVVTRGLLNNPIAFTTDLLGDETGCNGTFDGISGLAITIGSTLGDIVSRAMLGMFQLNEDIGDCGVDYKLFGMQIFGENENGTLRNCMKMALFETIKYLIAVLAFVVVGLAMLIALFRVWFSLLKSYMYMVIDILLAPFWILLGLIPGSTMTFSGWLKNIIAQLAVFPATALLLVFASIVAKNSTMNNPTQGAFLPPLIGNPNIADNLGALMAFSLILLTPELGNIIRDALKTPASKATAGASALIGVGAGVFAGGIKGVGGTYASSKEAILKPGGGAEARGMGHAIFSRLVH